MRLSLTIFLLVLALWNLSDGTQAAGGNCTSATPMVMTRPGANWTLAGMRFTALPDAPLNDQADQGSVTLELSSLVERDRRFDDVNGNPVPQGTCAYPLCPSDASDFLAICQLDPVLVTDPSVPCPGNSHNSSCGIIYTSLFVEDMNCYTEHVNDTLQGHPRESLITHLTHPLYSDFYGRLTAELIDETFDYLPNGPSSVVYHYRPNEAKVTFNVLNFPWRSPNDFVNSTYNNASFISMFWNTTLLANDPNSTLCLNTTLYTRQLSWTSSNGLSNYSMFINTDQILIDSNIFPLQISKARYVCMPFGTYQAFLQSFNLTGGITTLGLSLCEPEVGQHHNFTFDPDLGSLFSAPFGPSTSPSQGPRVNVVAAVVISLILVTIVIVVTVVLVKYNKTIRLLLRPFTQRLTK